jgi:hypothetical protein
MKRIALVFSALIFAGMAQQAAADQVLYDGVGFFVGQQSFEDSFSITAPGTLTITLSDMQWPDPLANLNLTLSTPKGMLGPTMGAGTETFDVTSGNVYAQWFGTAQGALEAGAYGLKISYAAATPVPLPTSAALLLSGLALLIWQRRARPALSRSASPT